MVIIFVLIEQRVTFDCHLESVFEYPAEPITPDSLSTQRPTCDSEVSHGCSTDAANAFPDIVNGKTLPSYPVCNGSGK